MSDDGQASHQPQFGIGQEGGSDQDAVGEVVHAVADQNHPAGFARLVLVMAVRVMVAVALVVVRMAQDGQLFQHEERQQPAQQGAEQAAWVGARLERFRQRVQQRG